MGFADALKGASSYSQGPGAQADGGSTYRQNGGCGARLYANGKGRDPAVIDLFQEIQSCDIDRSTTDVAGSFTMFLLPTAPWDELIRPDDFIRIFMGDQIVTSEPEPNAYNFANRTLDQNSSRSNLSAPLAGGVSIPIPNSTNLGGGGGQQKAVARLIMHERLIGKVDRISRVKAGPGPSQGTTVGFTISGRSMGSIIQDISLYYNEFLEPLNAVNIFFESKLGKAVSTPGEMVKEVLAIVLTSVPFPQWTLPDALVRDLNYATPGQPSLRQQNQAIVEEKLKGYKARLQAFLGSGDRPANYNSNIISKLQALTNEAGTVAPNSPFSVISLEGIFECFGANFNRSFLNSVSTGLADLVKGISNDHFNEFWFDLCPAGEPEGGRATSAPLVPTFCLRQRPYNITRDLLTGIASFLEGETTALLPAFPPQEIDGVSDDLLGLMESSFSVLGPCASPQVKLEGSFAAYKDDDTEGGFAPTLMPGGYDIGYSGHDRLNGFLCLGSANTGQATGESTRIIAASEGGFNLNPDSIKQYGIRVMEVTTPYAQPNGAKVQDQDLGQTMGTFSRSLANWYFMNQCFLNGQLSCRFLKQARIGVPMKYFETRITPDNPYPKMEVFYVQGVHDRFEYGQAISTTLTVIRGLRYDLGGGAPAAGPSKTRYDRLIESIKGLTS